MPGSGKSTLGKALAERLSISFTDLDNEIEEQEKRTIQNIFEVNGEEHFRQLEKNKIEELSYLPVPMLIATGGGTPCFHNNMKLMNEMGVTIFLNLTIEELVTRLVATNLETRPLYKGLSHMQLKEKLSSQFEERKLYYEQAQFVFTSKSNIDEIVKAL